MDTGDTGRELLKGNTPTLVLAVLKDAPLHGYGIAREIELRSGSALRFKEGTLYPALHSLERDGLIAGAWQQQPNARQRKVYTITPAGLAALERHTRTWTAFASAVQRVIQGSKSDEPSGEHGAGEGRTPLRNPARLEPAG